MFVVVCVCGWKSNHVEYPHVPRVAALPKSMSMPVAAKVAHGSAVRNKKVCVVWRGCGCVSTGVRVHAMCDAMCASGDEALCLCLCVCVCGYYLCLCVFVYVW